MTNRNKTVTYAGVTNDLTRRVFEHYNGLSQGFSNRYKCKYLVYYEIFDNIYDAIKREKQIKKWGTVKKNKLISDFNPGWDFLNSKISFL